MADRLRHRCTRISTTQSCSTGARRKAYTLPLMVSTCPLADRGEQKNDIGHVFFMCDKVSVSFGTCRRGSRNSAVPYGAGTRFSAIKASLATTSAPVSCGHRTIQNSHTHTFCFSGTGWTLVLSSPYVFPVFHFIVAHNPQVLNVRVRLRIIFAFDI